MPSGIEQQLGYNFRDPGLLQQALTHSSIKETGHKGAKHNERLEFLGDALLGCVISKWLYDIEPSATEGRMSQLRARIVRASTQLKIANNLGLKEVMRVGKSFVINEGEGSNKAIGDTLEALVGAIFIDGGHDEAKACIHRLFADEVKHACSLSTEHLKDFTTRLHEFLANKKLQWPNYSVTEQNYQRKDVNERCYRVKCKVKWHGGQIRIEDGTGSSTKFAKQAAAEKMLLALMHKNG